MAAEYTPNGRRGLYGSLPQIALTVCLGWWIAFPLSTVLEIVGSFG